MQVARSMSHALRQLITELRQGAEMSAEGASSIQWRQRIQKIRLVSIEEHGAGLFVICSSARNLLLQRGQVSAQSDTALCGVLIELANILEMDLTAQESRRKNRNDDRREVPWHLRSDA
jgi:hypothetical protein